MLHLIFISSSELSYNLFYLFNCCQSGNNRFFVAFVALIDNSMLHAMEYTPDQIEKAVSHFYQNSTTDSQLNLWLTSAQTSSQAWVFSWQLLDQSKVFCVFLSDKISILQ